MASPTKEVRKAYYQRNKEKILLATQERYLENKEHYLEYQKSYRRAKQTLISAKQKAVRQQKLRTLVVYLGDCCMRCNGIFPDCVYDFHHNVPKEKSFTIGTHMGYSIEKLKQEADKCSLLCSNCHRITHATQ